MVAGNTQLGKGKGALSGLFGDMAAQLPTPERSVDAVLFAGTDARASDARGALALSGNGGGVNLGSGAREKAEADQKRQDEKRERDQQDQYYRMMMARIDQLNREMEDIAAGLRETYGQDFVAGMAAAYLSEEENANARTDEERLEALAGVFLNPDGTVKPEYAGRPEAEYVRDWKESQFLKAGARQYPSMNSEQRTAYQQQVAAAGYGALASANSEISNSEAQAVVANEADSRFAQGAVRADASALAGL